MKEITLKELFEQFQLTIAGLARSLGKSREWLSAMAYDRLNLKPEMRAKHLAAINLKLQKISDELKNIKVK